MLKFDHAVILKHHTELNNALNLLNDLRSIKPDTFKKDQHLVGSAKYHLIVAIESAIDICNHLISKNSFRAPESYSDVFKVMAENNVLPLELVEEKLEAMARFRNRLVHIYWDIELDLLYQILQENLSDLDLFLAEINQHINHDNSDQK